jgi:hypothetical protein
VSSANITLTGSILAKGGGGGLTPSSCFLCNGHEQGGGGGGSGGAIHLVAPVISGNGAINASGGTTTVLNRGGAGRILISSANNGLTGSITPVPIVSHLFLTPSPTVIPSVRIVSINGVAAGANPVGNASVADVTISASAAVSVNIAASYIPLGTVIQLTLFVTGTPDQVVSCTPLAGTVSSSTATCSVAFAHGISITAMRASW